MLLRGAWSRGAPCGGRPYRQSGKCEVWRRKPGPSDPGADVESLLRGAPVRLCGAGYNASGNRTSQPGSRPEGRAGERDNLPVTMAREHPGRRAGSHGGASLAPIPRLEHPDRVARPSPYERPDPSGCYGSSIPRTSTSAPAMTTSASRPPRSESASSPPSSQRSIWRSRRRSISF